jgi:hypothetical protein
VLRKVFGREGEEEVGEWGPLHNEALSNLCSVPDVAGVIKLKSEICDVCAGHMVGW